MTFQSALREALLLCRGASGLSQENMADACDISVRYYRKLEAGNGNPSLKVLVNLRKKFGLDLNELVDHCTITPNEE